MRRLGLRGFQRVGSAILLTVLFSACDQPDSNQTQGYIEGEFVYMSAPLAGRLETLSVQRGAVVKAGDPLFALDNIPERAARDEAEGRLLQARANLEDAKKGKRPPEIGAVEAQLKQAQAALEFSSKELNRQEELLAHGGGATAQQEVDRARSTRTQDQQRVAQLRAELETARLGDRPDQIVAAEANVRAIEAALAKAEWNLAQTSQRAPQAAMVFDTLYREGEWIGADRLVVVLLPPGNVKLRVFVPETRLGSLHVGDSLEVLVDGAAQPASAKISFISPRSEYTPPVIYDRENRSKLVFMVEALFEPAVATRLHPGQPVDVRFNSARP
jgi:HlyD family secretion protein